MQQLFDFQFDGQKGQFDVGWQKARWYDYKNIQVPIDHANGSPTHWVYWEAEGPSYYGDGKDWNRFKSPEQRFVWKEFLPAHEHATLLNGIGQAYNWFQGNSPFHSRIARPTFLQKGQVEFTVEFWADWYKWDNGKVPLNQVGDPNNCRVELFMLDTGLSASLDWNTSDEGAIRRNQGQLQAVLSALPGQHEDWLIVNPTLGNTVKSKTFNVPRDGLYLLVFGVMTVWAVPGGQGRNGLFVHGISAKQVQGSPTPPPPTSTPTPPTPTPTPPTPTPPVSKTGRGAPRVQFERTYQLIHNSVPDNFAAQIFLDGRRQGKTTGFSADDAGVGDLDVKIVEVYGWPAGEQQDLVDFYHNHYPGVQVRFLGLG